MDLLTGERSRWSVIWYVPQRKAFKETEFGCDLAGALDLYTRALAAQKPHCTLRSQNVGFAPPERLRPHTRTKVVVRTIKGRRRRVKEDYTVEPMRALNTKGVWWCPYCMKLRRVQKQDGVLVEGIYVAAEGWYCPVCGTSHRDGHVRKWNPQAQMLEFRTIRRPTTRRRRRVRRA